MGEDKAAYCGTQPSQSRHLTWDVGQRLDSQGCRHKAGLLHGRDSQTGADQQGLQVVGQVDAAHGAAIHEGQSCVGCLLAQLQGGCIMQGKVDELLADGQVRPWVTVQHLHHTSDVSCDQR